MQIFQGFHFSCDTGTNLIALPRKYKFEKLVPDPPVRKNKKAFDSKKTKTFVEQFPFEKDIGASFTLERLLAKQCFRCQVL